MNEKGGRFPLSLALAVAAHALLFLLFVRLNVPTVVAGPKVDLVEVQLAGTGGGSGGPGSGTGQPGGAAPAAPRRTPVRQAPSKPPLVAVQAAANPVPAPVESAAPSPAASPVEPSPAVTAPTPADLPPREGTPAEASGESTAAGSGTGEAGIGVTGGDGSGFGSGTGGAGVGAGGSSGGLPGETVADIDPVPLRAIAAAYPLSARRLGQQGLVKVQADIDADGVVISCLVATSSGFASLDNAAVDAVRSTRFMPAVKNGRPVKSKLIVPIRFRLTQE